MLIPKRTKSIKLCQAKWRPWHVPCLPYLRYTSASTLFRFTLATPPHIAVYIFLQNPVLHFLPCITKLSFTLSKVAGSSPDEVDFFLN
jgi:hypothetical protein